MANPETNPSLQLDIMVSGQAPGEVREQLTPYKKHRLGKFHDRHIRNPAIFLLPTEPLTVDVPDDSWTHTVRTEQGNITHNASASMEYLNLNPFSEDAHNLTADSLEELIEMLDAQSGAGFGEGDWLWIIDAEESDPDFLVDEVDPDGGNEWELVVEITFLVPRISEVGV